VHEGDEPIELDAEDEAEISRGVAEIKSGSSSAPIALARFFAPDRCRSRSRSGSPHRR
jgi:hypothetical protein